MKLEQISALLFILWTLPFWLGVMVLIKLGSRGPVFYTQKRIGKDLKPFKLYKFRTMHIDGDVRLSEFLRENHKAKDEWENYRKLREFDPRITSIGKFLRRLSLDEVPQLLNIIKGEMSFVGPRPYLKEELHLIPERYNSIFSVRPGLTGLWQVSGRNNLTFEERLNLDVQYIKNRKTFKNLLYIIKTIPVVLRGDGAY